MIKSKAINIIFNPSFGLIPFVVLAILFLLRVDLRTSLIIGLTSCVVGIPIASYTKHRVMSAVFGLSFILCFFIFISYFFFQDYIPYDLSSFVFGEIFFVLSLIFIVFFKTFIKYSFKLSKSTRMRDKLFIHDYFSTASILLALMCSHLFFIIALSQFKFMIYREDIRLTLYVIIPMAIFIFIYIYQAIRSIKLENKIKKEEWLPIISEDERVIGRVSKVVSDNRKAKYMHPVIRIIIKKSNEIYLQKRDSMDYAPNQYDLPIEYFMKFEETASIALSKITSKLIRNRVRKPEFIFDYIFQNEETNRKIYIYIIEIDNEIQLNNTGLNGKFWSIKQIDEHFNDEIFSEFFEMEYEYIKNTILIDKVKRINLMNARAI